MSAATYFRPLIDDSTTRALWKIGNFLYVGLGLGGAERVADTAVHSGTYWIFHAITDCVIAGITYSPLAGGAGAGDKILAGDRIFGRIVAFQLASGTGELYRASAP